MLAQQHRRVLQWLGDKGTIPRSCLVDPKARLTSHRRRNELFEFTAPDAIAVFVKHWPQDADAATREVDGIGHASALLQGDDFNLPEILAHDPSRGLCAFRLIHGATDLRRLALHQDGCSTSDVAEIGRLLGQLHLMSSRHGKGKWQASPVRPWALSVAQPTEAARAAASAATEAFWADLLADDRLMRLISALQISWYETEFIHGDMRLENILIGSGDGAAENCGLIVVDWELSTAGEGLWDAACLVASLLEVWISSKDADNHADHGLEWLVPRLSSFWQAYTDRRGWQTTQGKEAVRCVALAAVRLVQYALEATQKALTPSSRAHLLVQVAENILEEPRIAAARFLGATR